MDNIQELRVVLQRLLEPETSDEWAVVDQLSLWSPSGLGTLVALLERLADRDV